MEAFETPEHHTPPPITEVHATPNNLTYSLSYNQRQFPSASEK